MAPSSSEIQPHFHQLYDLHPFECHLSTLHHRDRYAHFDSQSPRTLRDPALNHSNVRQAFSILNGIAHLLGKSTDSTKSRIPVPVFRSGAGTTRACPPHTTIVHCKDTRLAGIEEVYLQGVASLRGCQCCGSVGMTSWHCVCPCWWSRLFHGVGRGYMSWRGS